MFVVVFGGFFFGGGVCFLGFWVFFGGVGGENENKWKWRNMLKLEERIS